MRRWWIAMGAAALLLVGVVTIVDSQPGSPSEPLGPLWSRRISDVVSLSVSPDGGAVLAIGLDGTTRCYDARGGIRWERRMEGVDQGLLGRGGAVAVLYGARRPMARSVYFLDGQGRELGRLEAPEPVRAAVLSSDGDAAAVSTQSRVLYCGLRGGAVKSRSIPLARPPAQIQIGPGDTLFVLHDLGVDRIKSGGRRLWRWSAPGGRIVSISASEGGSFLACGVEGPDESAQVYLLDAGRRVRWSAVRPGRAPRVRVSAGGTAVILSYEHRVEHQDQSRFEQRLAYLSGADGGSWTKGGAYTAPLYVSVERDGEWVVALDTQKQAASPHLRLYGRGGERRWIYQCPADVFIATASRDGRRIAAYRADRVLEYVGVADR